MTTTPVVNTSVGPNRTAHRVTSIGGQVLDLQTADEKKYYESARDKYLSENKFTHASDLRGLDRLLLLEVQVQRWQWQLAAGVDYDLNFLDAREEAALQKSLKETSAMISNIQMDLGLTKLQRDKEQADSVGAYLVQLKQRAKEMGVMREKQLGKALELTKELFNLVGAYQRSNEAERRKLGFESPEDILDWVTEVMKPSFDEVDEHFRKNQQRFWIRNV